MLGRHYKSHQERSLREFLTPGLKLPAAVPGDRRVRLHVSSEAPIAGLPVELEE